MVWEFSNDRTIASQIVESIQKGILSGHYPPGSDIPSVRVLALEAGVNPNTMQKALADLETQGLLQTQRTIGRKVTTDQDLIKKLKEQLAAELIQEYFVEMEHLGIARERAIEMLIASRDATPAADSGLLSKPSEVN